VKRSVLSAERYDRSRRGSIAQSGPVDSADVNPRYRRMVIPGALIALILIVVVAALVG
jgi:hypothetical protein